MANPRDLLAQEADLRPDEQFLAHDMEAGEVRFLRIMRTGKPPFVMIAWSTGTASFVASFSELETDLAVLLARAGSDGFALWMQGFNERRNADKSISWQTQAAAGRG